MLNAYKSLSYWRLNVLQKAGPVASCITLVTASERIRSMESELGLPLLLHELRGVSLTPRGRMLQSHALLVLQQIERMQGVLGDLASGLRD